MSEQVIAAAIQRLRAIFRRHPEAAVHDDAPATARWERGLRVVASDGNGAQVVTDLPVELGGTGDQVTPGWLFRASLASCAVTSIALSAAAEGIALSALEVSANSRSDARGLLGMQDPPGVPVYAGPGHVVMQVKIAAAGVAPQQLRALVEASLRQSPIPNALSQATPLVLQIDVGAS